MKRSFLKNKRFELLAIGIAVFVVALIIGTILFVVRRKECFDQTDLVKYVGLNDNEVQIILENEEYDKRGVRIDGRIYVPLELLTDKFRSELFWDEPEHVMICVKPGELWQIQPNTPVVNINGREVTKDFKILVTYNGTFMIDFDFLAQNADIIFNEYLVPDRLVIFYSGRDFLFYNVKDNAPVHADSSVSSQIITTLPQGERVYYIGGYGNKGSSFVKVMTDNGLFGYVQRKHFDGSFHDIVLTPRKAVAEQHVLLDDKVKLGWHQISVKGGNATFDKYVTEADGMNVICPTWFTLDDDLGNITSIGEAGYVEKAHAMGLDVWVLVDNFKEGVSTQKLLKSTERRLRLVGNLISTAKMHGADGINVDFEAVPRDSGELFVQFIRELSVSAHLQGLVVSVDNYVPSEYRAYYDIETQAKYADYIILMAYDEHYSGGKAGSVSSLPFVQKAISDTLKMVDKDRIILGVPFYTRLWKTKGDEVTSEVVSMYATPEKLKEYGIETKFDNGTYQNYGYTKIDGITYEMWVEDSTSLAYKLAAARGYDIGGIAAWRLGLQSDGTWDLINSFLGEKEWIQN